MKRSVRIFCDDCPYPDRMCNTDEDKCATAHWVKKTVDAAPPLTPEQIAKIGVILLSARKERGSD